MQLPLTWLRSYDAGNLRADVVAGLTVGALLVPQAMAYATLAGLPAVMGLYASLAPLVIYALLGSSRHLSVGPMAVVSLLVASGITAMGVEAGSQRYINLALLLALSSGCLQLMLGIGRMGVLCNYVSHAVTNGFTSAAAITIGMSQLGPLLGVSLARATSPLDILGEVWLHGSTANLPTVALGAIALLALVVLRKTAPKLPASLIVLAAGTIVTWAAHLEELGVATVGTVPVGLPSFALVPMDWQAIRTLLPAAIAIALVGFLGSIAVAQSIAIRERYRVEPDQELIALGAANIAAAFSSGIPVTGSLSRTAVNQGAGAKTPAASLVSAAFVALSLLLFTPLFRHLPTAVLAAIIVASALRLVDLRLPWRLFNLRATDGLTLAATFFVTLFVGAIEGIFAGVGLSLVVFIWRTSHPHVAELGYRSACEDFRDIDRYSDAETFPGILILRVDARLYFANAGFVNDEIVARLNDQPDATRVILDLSGVNDIDAVSIATLERLFEQCAERGCPVSMARMKGAVRDIAARAGWLAESGEPSTYATISDALEAAGVDVNTEQ